MLCVTFSALTAVLGLVGETPAQKPYSPLPKTAAIMCFFKGEQVSGMNKICYYDCLGSTTAINVSSIQLCPLSINR